MRRPTPKQRSVLEQLAALPEGETRRAGQLGVKQHKVLWRLRWWTPPLISYKPMLPRTWTEADFHWYITEAGRKALE